MGVPAVLVGAPQGEEVHRAYMNGMLTALRALIPKDEREIADTSNAIHKVLSATLWQLHDPDISFDEWCESQRNVTPDLQIVQD